MEEKNEICSFQNLQTALLCRMEIVHHVKGTIEIRITVHILNAYFYIFLLIKYLKLCI